jgi:hypothetical protein
VTALGYAVDALLALGLLVTAIHMAVAAARDACRLLRRGTARRRPATAVPAVRVADAVLRFGGLDDTSAVPVVTRVTEPLSGGARPMTALARPVHQAHLDRVASGPPTEVIAVTPSGLAGLGDVDPGPGTGEW